MEDFVPFEIAKKLKEKGFEIQGGFQYLYYNEELVEVYDYCNISPYKYAPTISQVLKWLREEKKMHIEIFLYNGSYSYFIKSITQICKVDLFHECLNEDTAEEEYATYEQAVLAGMEYCLDKLI